MIKKLALILILISSTVGCKAFTSGMLEDAEQHLRLKWAEEWKPSLKNEVAESISKTKDVVLSQVLDALEHQESNIDARLASVNVQLENFDSNKDGYVTGAESLQLLKQLKEAKDEDGNPLSWPEILMAVILGYGGTTAGKEWVKSKMTPNGATSDPNSA